MEEKIINGIKYRLDKETLTAEVIRKQGNSKPVSVMTIDGLRYTPSVIESDNPYELTILCDESWGGGF